MKCCHTVLLNMYHSVSLCSHAGCHTGRMDALSFGSFVFLILNTILRRHSLFLFQSQFCSFTLAHLWKHYFIIYLFIHYEQLFHGTSQQHQKTFYSWFKTYKLANVTKMKSCLITVWATLVKRFRCFELWQPMFPKYKSAYCIIQECQLNKHWTIL